MKRQRQINPSEDCFEGKIYPIIAIGNFAFGKCAGLTSIIISNSVTEIGEDAFLGCTALTSIVINDISLLKWAGVPKGVELVTP